MQSLRKQLAFSMVGNVRFRCGYPQMPAPRLSLPLRWSRSKVSHPLTGRTIARVSTRSMHVSIPSYAQCQRQTHHSLALLHIDLVAYYDLYAISLVPPKPLSGIHTNGKVSGSIGLACIKNSSLQLSRVSKLLELFTSYTRTQQSAPL